MPPTLGLFYQLMRRRDDDDDDDNDSDFGDDRDDDFHWRDDFDSDSDLSSGAIAGIVIALVLVALLAVGLCLFIRHRKRRANGAAAIKDGDRTNDPPPSSTAFLPVAVHNFQRRVGALAQGAMSGLRLGRRGSKKASKEALREPPPEYSEHDPSTTASTHGGSVQIAPGSVASERATSPPPVPEKIV
ncbi:hypothetical protein HOO65_030144 [Ceratocystis lukuohia]|uniref:Uncharacterized protein n=1 Tax=Ceratocystis lukuohia TaxID=2019550 RepID=A0ABR4MK09_9PEZI